MERSIDMRGLALKRLRSLDSVITSGSASAALRRQLLNEANFFQHDYSREIRRRANACTPLLQLPREIITAVASHLAKVWDPNALHCVRSSRSRATSPSIGWVTLSHVCSFLRTIVLEHQLLWARAVSDFPTAQGVLLRRAGTAPIFFDIVQDTLCDHQEEHFELFMKHMHRAGEIHVTRKYSSSKDESKDYWLLDPAIFLGREFPSLKVLDIDFEHFTRHTEEISGLHSKLPTMITPSLRRLKLHSFFIPFSAETLSYLDISRKKSNGSPPPASWFLNMLRQCTNIQYLRLVGWIPDTPSWDLDEPYPDGIIFPSLTTMVVEDSDRSCLRLDPYLRLPPSSSITYEMSYAGDADTLGHIIGLFERHFRLKADILGSLRLCIEVDREFGLFSFTLASTANPSVSLLFLWWWCNKALFDLEPAVERISSICAEDTYQLEITNQPDHHVTQGHWRRLLEPFSQLQRLRVDGNGSVGNLWKVLTVYSDSAPLLPALTELELERITLSEAGTDGTPDDVLRMVSSRRRADMLIQRLQITSLLLEDIEVHESFIPLLRIVVPDLDVCIDPY